MWFGETYPRLNYEQMSRLGAAIDQGLTLALSISSKDSPRILYSWRPPKSYTGCP
jgi:hypothetical protein